VWCQHSYLADLINVDSVRAIDPMLKVSEFILPDNRWNILELSQIVPASVLPHVLAVPIALTNIPDTFCWRFIGSVESSVKFATWQAHDNIGSDPSPWKFKWIQKLDVLLKMQIFGNYVTMHSPLWVTYCVEGYILILFVQHISLSH